MTAPAGLSEFSIALRAGTLLSDQYTVVGVLGRPGGFGITYLAEDIRLDTLVAIKEFLPRELATRAPDRSTIITHSGDHDSSFHRGLEQFLREARTLAKIHHPSVVRVRQFFEANGTAYLVMDYLEGQTLSELVKQEGGRLPAALAVDIIVRVLDGLRAAHALNIYHRDVKPSNIYITAAGLPVLLDFGAARQATGTSGASMTAVLTPGFAPLEQYGHRGQGPWTDVYAASAVLYQLLTGVDPVPATDRVGDETDPMVAPGDIDPDIGQALSDAVMKGLAMAPRGRPQTAHDFQELLRSSLAEQQRAAAAPSHLPALPPQTVAAERITPPRFASLEPKQATPVPQSQSSPPAPVSVPSAPVSSAREPAVVDARSGSVPTETTSPVAALLARVRKAPAIAASIVVGAAAVVALFVSLGRGDQTPAPVEPVATDTTPTTKAAEVPAVASSAPSPDSIRLAQRAADSAAQADSIALARRRTKARADSMALAAAARTARPPAAAPRKSSPIIPTTPVQAGQVASRPATDSAKPAQQVPDPRYSGYSNPNAAVTPPQPPPSNPAPLTFGVAVRREVQRLVDLFSAGDRRGVSRVFGTDQTDRIWRNFDGHPQISASATVVDTNQADSTANFFLVVVDRASQVSLLSGEFRATFVPIPGGLRFLTVTPQRR
jgi:serine/threonine protein kinase